MKDRGFDRASPNKTNIITEADCMSPIFDQMFNL